MTPIKVNHKLTLVTMEKGEDKESVEGRNSELVAIGSSCFHYALCPVHYALCSKVAVYDPHH